MSSPDPHDGAEGDLVEPEAVELPLDGELDLHLFRNEDTQAVIESYLEACQEVGVLLVRIVHGKGTGAKKRQVEKLVDSMAMVESRQTATERDGGWGATFVRLKPKPG